MLISTALCSMVVYNHWTGLVDWTGGLSFFLFVFHFSTYLGNIATLNVKCAGESVYLALSVILELCVILSLLA